MQLKESFYHKFKSPLGIIFLIIIAVGLYSYSQMKVELLPNVTFPKVKIIADNGEQPVDKMLITVTRPLEEAIKKSENLQMIQSTTSRGTCEISAFFNWDADIDLARQQIDARISESRTDLPADLKVVIEKMNPSILAAAGYSLEGDLSPVALKKIAVYTVKPYLEQIDGIREVAVTGGRNKEYQLVLNPEKMSALGITPETIGTALSQTNFIRSNGYLNDNHRLYLSLTDAAVKDLGQLERTVVRSTGNSTVLLKDVADVKIDGQIEYLKIKANGKDVPLIAVMKQPEANLSDMDAQLKQRVNELNSHLLPKGVKMVPYYNQADFVDTTIKSIRDVLWVGILLAIIVTILFLRSFKSSIVILITVPVSLLLTIIAMKAFGFNLNIMTLGAIAAAIGLVIDDAVVVVEQIHRTHEEHPEENYRTVVPKAIKYLLPAMVGSSLSTIVIFLPFGLMTGVAGAYFNIMTQTMIITLTASFLVTWLLLPVLYLIFFGNTREKHLKTAEVRKQNWVLFFLKRPYIAIALVVAMIVAIFVIYPALPSGFLPEMDEGSIVLDFNSPPGTSLDETDLMLQKADQIVTSMPEVESYSRRAGTQMGFFITEPNRGDYLIKLKTKRQRTTEEVIDDIRTRIEAQIPALTVDFGQVIGDMLGDLMSSTQPIEIKLFGNDTKQLEEYSQKIADVVDHVPGTADVFDGITIAGPSVVVEPDEAKLNRFNLTPDNFQYQLQTQLGGIVVGNIQESLQMCDVRMIYPNRLGTTVDALKESQIFLPDGQLVPMKRVADVSLSQGVAEMNRENLKSVDYITARLNNRDLGSTLADIQKEIRTKINLPPGMNLEYGGAYKEQQQAFQELMLILILASVLVFTIILFLFRRIKVALLLIFLVMLAPAGSGLLLYLLNVPLNVGSYVGIIMIIGIVGEASIFTYLQYMEERQKGESVRDSIVYSISIRLRPKLMTALSAIMALLPLALGIGSGAQMHQSLAIAVIGGLVFALPVLLIALPTFLGLIERD
ncbi:efflux RND transporter permease subunit [Mangrovibacterium lignilyticum]|uniref:efflux RND transporter permease subunit n=1 Tax=Mangrovibacterium lignilyticum TaxID=2668052 RepID=UPI0013CFCF21|nr:efflux RND transporter permease subunit [Mangrovibacterium lignilyticum]